MDETYIGGKARNMHKRRPQAEDHRGAARVEDKTVGARACSSAAARSAPRSSPNITQATLQRLRPRSTSQPGASVYTDAFRRTPDSTATTTTRRSTTPSEYVDGQRPHQRHRELLGLLKRGLHGTYISVEPFHLFRYLDERMFTFNQRDLTDLGRFEKVLAAVTGRRLTCTSG